MVADPFKTVLFVKRGLVIAISFSVNFDQAKHRIRPAAPGYGHGLGDARVHRGSNGKGAGTDDARDRGHGEETAPGGITWREHLGWSVADVFVGGVIYTLSALVIGFRLLSGRG